MVAANNNIYIKEYSKISSKKKKDKLFVEEDAFKAMILDKYSALDYRNTKGKIKSNEPLVITPVWDYGASDYLEKIDAGADLVQIYTGFIFEGPKLIRDIIIIDSP